MKTLRIPFGIACLLTLVSCGMHNKRNEEIGMIRKYDSEIEMVDRKIDSLERHSKEPAYSAADAEHDSLIVVRKSLEESRRYWQLKAGSEIQKDWDSQKNCLEINNNCLPAEKKAGVRK